MDVIFLGGPEDGKVRAVERFGPVIAVHDGPKIEALGNDSYLVLPRPLYYHAERIRLFGRTIHCYVFSGMHPADRDSYAIRHLLTDKAQGLLVVEP